MRTLPECEPPPVVAHALARLGIDPATVRPLATTASAFATPRTFLVVDPGGARFKARVARSADAASRATVRARRLADPRVPAPLAHVGTVTIERWVPGVTLDEATPTGGQIDEAAELLAAVHRTHGGRPPAMRPVRAARRAERELEVLSLAGVVDDALRARAAAALERLPAEALFGLVHGDLCGANLVVTGDGRLVSVDNELLAPGHLDYDLARAWYRWPLPDDLQRRFDDAYAAAAARIPDPATRRAWRVAATVRGAFVRHELGTAPDPAIRRLATALAED